MIISAEKVLENFQSVDIDEAAGSITYISREGFDGTWWITKIDASTNPTTFRHATIKNNTTVKKYTDAFTARATLTYGYLYQAF